MTNRGFLDYISQTFPGEWTAREKGGAWNIILL